MDVKFFESPSEFREWLQSNYNKRTELWVGFYKRATGKPSVTWPESVDEALCFGWIDGLRKSIDADSYKIRFSPRKPKSTWSAINTKRARDLIKTGRMHASGLKAFESRSTDKTGIYSYEQRPKKFPEPYEKQFRANKKAWTYFQSRPAWYQRATIWWVVSAKREETRSKRLNLLIQDSENQRVIAPLNRVDKDR